MIGIGGISRCHPSHTSGHTGPSLGGYRLEVSDVERVVATNIKPDGTGFVRELHILGKAIAAALESATVPGHGTRRTGPKKRGNMCVTGVDLNRGYGFQSGVPCPTGAAPKRTATRR